MSFETFSYASRIQSGDLKVVAGRDDSVLDIDSGKGENNEEFRFADEDDFPLLKTQTKQLWTMWFVNEYENTCICDSEVRTLLKSC